MCSSPKRGEEPVTEVPDSCSIIISLCVLPVSEGGAVRRIFNPGVSAALSCAEGGEVRTFRERPFLKTTCCCLFPFASCKLLSTVVFTTV